MTPMEAGIWGEAADFFFCCCVSVRKGGMRSSVRKNSCTSERVCFALIGCSLMLRGHRSCGRALLSPSTAATGSPSACGAGASAAADVAGATESVAPAMAVAGPAGRPLPGWTSSAPASAFVPAAIAGASSVWAVAPVDSAGSVEDRPRMAATYLRSSAAFSAPAIFWKLASAASTLSWGYSRGAAADGSACASWLESPGCCSSAAGSAFSIFVMGRMLVRRTTSPLGITSFTRKSVYLCLRMTENPGRLLVHSVMPTASS
mmetsp:Transcript_9439/g.28409  ORF Transcript_9439/g.28409 Transcript_9439/m.28409 type:complete len:261 (+) Transcript_9439:1011-1793(+)